MDEEKFYLALGYVMAARMRANAGDKGAIESPEYLQHALAMLQHMPEDLEGIWRDSILKSVMVN